MKGKILLLVTWPDVLSEAWEDFVWNVAGDRAEHCQSVRTLGRGEFISVAHFIHGGNS